MRHAGIISKRWTFLLFGLLASLSTVTAARAGDPLVNTPPLKPVRIPAEFEPMQAVIVTPNIMGADILYKRLAEDVKVIVLWDTARIRDNAQRDFAKYGVNLANCEFIQVAYTLMERDLLPWLMFTDHNEPAFVYNQLIGDMYAVPQYGLEQGYTVYRSGLSVPGGDFMTDGRGAAVSLDGVAIHNAEIKDFTERVRDYWGVHSYHFIGNQGGSKRYLHVDCMAKFLSPDTIMVARPPSSHVLSERAEKAAAYFRRQVSCYGTPYRVVRVDSPDEEPYTNSLIVNRRVYVPVLDHGADANALAGYRAAMPGYEVIGIRNGPAWGRSWWPSGMALHCMTLGIADEKMLYIEHTPVLDRPPAGRGFPISAKIVAHSKTAFVDGTPVVLWRTAAAAGGPQEQPAASWNSVPMVRAPELGDHRYLAHIPAQPLGTKIQYYLRAKDASGRDETHPYIGEPQAHAFMATALGANVSAVSARRGGEIELYVNAGPQNARRDYHLACEVIADPNRADVPPTALPDAAVSIGFDGELDDGGIATARMTIAELPASDWVGRSLRFSLNPDDPNNAVSETVRIEILE